MRTRFAVFAVVVAAGGVLLVLPRSQHAEAAACTGPAVQAPAGQAGALQLSLPQLQVVQSIVGTAKGMGIAKRGVVVALQVAKQESQFDAAVTVGSSVGSFQQIAPGPGNAYAGYDRTNPAMAAKGFFTVLLSRDSGYARACLHPRGQRRRELRDRQAGVAGHLARRGRDHDLPARSGHGGAAMTARAIEISSGTQPPATPAPGPGREPSRKHREPRRIRWLDRAGWYEPRETGSRSTTRQAEALNLALSSSPTTHRGLILGTDRLSGQVVCHDPFIAYADRLVSAPNAAVIGDVGKGKSSLLKTWGTLRQLLLDGRRVVVLDKKTQAGQGEYTPLARAVGAPSIRFTVDGTGSRLNLLDPVIALGEEGDRGASAGRPTGQMMLLRAVLAEALGRGVTEREGKALRLALLAATRDARDRGRVPVIGDVVHHLISPQAEAAAGIGIAVPELRDWGFDPAFALERMIEEDLAGLVDAETTPDVQLGHPSGLVHFDISGLPVEGPALRIVMTVINTWQTNMLAQRSQQLMQTVNIVEEGWHVAEGALGKVFQRNTKLSRGLGLATLAGFHHISDLPAGTAARSLLQEAETVFIFGQSLRSDALACVELYDLPPGTEHTIMGLGRGTFLMKIGAEAPLLVQHIRSAEEVRLTETDAAMTGRESTTG